jgi:hypothetical protein
MSSLQFRLAGIEMAIRDGDQIRNRVCRELG